MSTIGWLGLAWLTAFLVNLAPAFMPPVSGVLAAFRIGADVPLLPLTIGGSICGAIGRSLLALGTRHTTRYLPAADRANAEALGNWFLRRGRWRWPLVALYCAGPFPSNLLFIAAGAGRVPLLPLAAIFVAARSVSDTFWVWTGATVAENASGLIHSALTDWRSLLVQLATAVGVVLIFRLPWDRWLRLHG